MPPKTTQKKRYILGLETSCDETAAAIIDDNLNIKASVVASQIDIHKLTQGVVPEVAARTHTENIMPVVQQCLEQAGVKPDQFAGIAVTRGPGLITSLLVGLETAKALSFGWNVPLLGVNHIEGHILSNLIEAGGIKQGRITFAKSRLPIVILTVSGGHTELFTMRRPGHYTFLGRTRDDAAGEAFDKVAKLLGLPYPGGPSISKAALKGRATAYDFPRPMLKSGDYDFSFAGLKTAVLREVETMSQAKLKRATPDIAASFQQAVADTLLGKAEFALKEYKAQEFWLVGGVAANQLLRKDATRLAKRLNVKLQIPSFEFCTDNAVMIATAGLLRLRRGDQDKQGTLQADPNLDLIATLPA